MTSRSSAKTKGPSLSYLRSIRHSSFEGNIGTSTHYDSWWILLIRITLLADLPAAPTNSPILLALARIPPLALAELDSQQYKEVDELKGGERDVESETGSPDTRALRKALPQKEDRSDDSCAADEPD